MQFWDEKWITLTVQVATLFDVRASLASVVLVMIKELLLLLLLQ